MERVGGLRMEGWWVSGEESGCKQGMFWWYVLSLACLEFCFEGVALYHVEVVWNYIYLSCHPT